MKLKEAKEIYQCLPRGKTRFYYFKDRYALLLLSFALGSTASKRELKQSRFAKLLDKAVVKDALRMCRGGGVSAEALETIWPNEYECYFLTLGIWGSNKRDSWYQTSRCGFNLVLQLNFSSKHNDPYEKLLEPDGCRAFEWDFHPINKRGFRTLAWSRLDIDLGTGEALIEEIQTDWVREALSDRRCFGDDPTNKTVRYVDEVLKPHIGMWDEAMLAATIWFLRCELGIQTIFYHTYESGSAIKRIRYGKPPRSVYSRLPRRFCFVETDSRPAFLPKKRKAAKAKKTLEESRFQELSWM